jgi:hypothetical protein
MTFSMSFTGLMDVAIIVRTWPVTNVKNNQASTAAEIALVCVSYIVKSAW